MRSSYFFYFLIFLYSVYSAADFKEFEPRLKYDWFHLKLYIMFQDLSRFLVDLRRDSIH